MNRAVTIGNTQNIPPEDNPLLEGIHIVSTEAEMFRLIARNPFLNKKWLAANQDYDLFRAYLSGVVAPTSQVIKFAIDIHKALKTSAYQLCPLVDQNRISYFSSTHSTATYANTQTTHCGVVLLGPTGLGKTHLLVSALSTIPQTIQRRGFPGMAEVTQITWIRIDMSSIASIDALAEQIIRAIDDALGSQDEMFNSIVSGAKSASAKMERALRLMRTHYVSILAVDEIQANNFSKLVSSDIRDWFLRIANQKIALVFSGNPLGFELQPAKKENEESRIATQQLRRLFSANRTRLDPVESVREPDWQIFIRTLATCHIDGSRDNYDEALEILKLKLTGGFHDFYVALHVELEKLRNTLPEKIIDDQLITKAAKNSSLIQVMEPLISAFSSRDAIALRRCTDVDYEYYSEKWQHQAGTLLGPGNQSFECPPNREFAKSVEITSEIIAETRQTLENRVKNKRDKKHQQTSPIKNEVLAHHLEHLNELITGISPDDANG